MNDDGTENCTNMLLDRRPLSFREAEILHSSLSRRPRYVRCSRVGLLLDSVHDGEVVGFVSLANGDGDECEFAFLRSRPADLSLLSREY